MKQGNETLNISRTGANLQVDPLPFTVFEEELKILKANRNSDGAEEVAMNVLSHAITRSLGGGISARVSKLADAYVLNIVQEHSRLSEMLPREIVGWIKEIKTNYASEKRNFQIVLPHSVMVKAGRDLKFSL